MWEEISVSIQETWLISWGGRLTAGAVERFFGIVASVLYCRSRTSSIATLPPFSMFTTLWTGLNPVSVISTT